MSKAQKQVEGAQFVQWFGPLLDALRALGGSGTPDEVKDNIAATLGVPDEQLNEVLPSGESRFRNQVAWARFYLGARRSSRFLSARYLESYGEGPLNLSFTRR